MDNKIHDHENGSRTVTPLEMPGRNGSPSERLLGRTGTPQDFNSTAYTWEGLEDICLENIVMAQLNQDVLKKNFEIIINALKKQNFQIGKLGKQTSLNDDLINELRERLEKQEVLIRDLNEKNVLLDHEVKDLKAENSDLWEEIEKLKKKDSDQQIEIDELKNRIMTLEDKIKEFGDNENRLRNLEEKSLVHDERINECQERLNNLESRLNELMSKIADILGKYENFEEKIKLMESLNNSEGGGDLSGLINEITEIKNKFKNYATRDDFSSLKEDVDYLLKEIKKVADKLDILSKEFNVLKLEELPNRFAEIKKEFQTIYEMLKNLKNQSGSTEGSNNNSLLSTEASELINGFNDKLSNKVNCEDFDRLLSEIALLHERINALGKDKPTSMTDINKNNASNTVISSKDSNLIKDLIGRTNDLEALIKKLQKELAEHVTTYAAFTKETGNKFKNLDEKKMDKFDLEDILKRLSALENELKNVKEKLSNNEKIVGNHEIAINDILKELARMRKRKSSNNTATGINPEQVSSLMDDLINKLRQEVFKAIDDIKKLLCKKIEMEDLWKSEAAILEKIDEIIAILAKKFCDKNETKKALIYIENRLNQLFAAVFGDGTEKDNDALFAKKPLFWSCASCDKELDKFQGKLGDYKNWGQFPPKNTSPERMGRFGTGYARMVEDRKTHLAKEREKIKSQMAASQKGTNYENFPDINNFKEPPKGSNLKTKPVPNK